MFEHVWAATRPRFIEGTSQEKWMTTYALVVRHDLPKPTCLPQWDQKGRNIPGHSKQSHQSHPPTMQVGTRAFPHRMEVLRNSLQVDICLSSLPVDDCFQIIGRHFTPHSSKEWVGGEISDPHLAAQTCSQNGHNIQSIKQHLIDSALPPSKWQLLSMSGTISNGF